MQTQWISLFTGFWCETPYSSNHSCAVFIGVYGWTNASFTVVADLVGANGTSLTELVDGQPRGYRGILHALRRLVRLEAERRHVTVESATALAPAERERVMAGLAEKYGSNLTFEFREESGLLGGMRVQVGSDVFDGSVKGRLARLSEAF